MQAGNHTSLQYSIVAVKSIPVLTQCSIVTVHSVPPALARPPAWCSPRTSRRAFLSILVAACTSDMASRILPEYPVPIPAGRQGVSPANVLGVGPRRASVGAGLESCNGNDRRQRRKQGVAVGAAASKTQAIAKRLLGAATRRCSRRKLPAGLLTTIAVTVSFQLTVLIQAHPRPKAGERCAF